MPSAMARSFVGRALLLALVVTSEMAVGNSNTTNDAGNHLPLYPRAQIDSDNNHHDSEFTATGRYISAMQVIFPVMTAVSLELLRPNLYQMMYGTECTLANNKTGVFNPVGRGHPSDIPIMTFPESIPVLVSSVGMNNETVKIVPYCAETLGMKGFVAIMAVEVQNVPNNDAIPLHHNSLLVAMDCKPFNEHVEGTMAPLTEGLDAELERRLSEHRVATFVFFDLNHDHDVNTKEYEYCPTKDYITVVPGGTCKHLWPHGLPDHQGPKVWLEEWLHKNAGEPEAKQPGPRIDLGMNGRVPNVHRMLFGLYIALVIAISYSFTFTSLTYPELSQGKTVLSLLFWYPEDTAEAPDGLIVLKLLAGPLVLFIVVVLRVLAGGMLKYFLRYRAEQGHKQISTTIVMRVSWILKGIMMILGLYLPPLLFFNAKNVGNNKAKVIKNLTLVMSWINFELALIFFANNLIQAFNSAFKMAIPEIVDAMSGDVILGVTGLSSALLDLVSITRDGHGINDGCELEELGNTFRILARDRPETFPAGAQLSLFCTESDLNFTTVFNSTAEQLKAMGVARFDDGNMCNLVCTLPTTGNPPRMPSSTFPIWCKDNGFNGARWTLSSLRGLLAPRLCPNPRQSAP